MNLKKYKFTGSDTYLDFEFYSDGPNGKIRKVVRFSPQNSLATIAATVLEFTKRFPDVMVYAKGSTPARTRLYQIGISANWDEIVNLHTLKGNLDAFRIQKEANKKKACQSKSQRQSKRLW
jgi:hypothetical protein